MNHHIPSRVLNYPSFLFGLSFNDLTGLGVLLGFLQVCLKPFGLEFYALILTALGMICLVPVRVRYRRKSIRDYVRNLFERRIKVSRRN